MTKKINSYKKFIKSLLMFLLNIILLDYLIGLGLSHFYFSVKSGDNYKMIYSMDSTRDQIIILGSSRAAQDYNPVQIQDSIGMSCYNAGRNGCLLFYNYSVFKEIIKRYSPNIIVFDISPKDFFMATSHYDDIGLLKPFYKSRPELRPIIELKEPFEKIKMLSSIYPYNSTLINLFRDRFSNYEPDSLKGWLPNKNKNGSSIDRSMLKPEYTDSSKLDPNKIKYFKDLISECRERNIKLILINSPRYSINNFSKAERLIYNTAIENNIPYFNYEQDPNFINNPSLFYDILHLNVNGAKIFTDSIIKDIRKVFLKKN